MANHCGCTLDGWIYVALQLILISYVVLKKYFVLIWFTNSSSRGSSPNRSSTKFTSQVLSSNHANRCAVHWRSKICRFIFGSSFPFQAGYKRLRWRCCYSAKLGVRVNLHMAQLALLKESGKLFIQQATIHEHTETCWFMQRNVFWKLGNCFERDSSSRCRIREHVSSISARWGPKWGISV